MRVTIMLVALLGCVPPQPQSPEPPPVESEDSSTVYDSPAEERGEPIETAAGERCRTEHVNDCPALSYCCVVDESLQTYGCSKTCYWP